MQYTDPLTKEVFYPKRSDQKFASRKNQIRFNNLKARKKRALKKKLGMFWRVFMRKIM